MKELGKKPPNTHKRKKSMATDRKVLQFEFWRINPETKQGRCATNSFVSHPAISMGQVQNQVYLNTH